MRKTLEVIIKKHLIYCLMIDNRLLSHELGGYRYGSGIDDKEKKKRPSNTTVQDTRNPNVYMAIKRIGCRHAVSGGI